MKKFGSFWVPDAEYLQMEALSAGGWQLDHLEAALAHVTDWSCAVDGGAHVGSWTIEMAKRFGKVIAFEPAPDTHEALEANTLWLKNVVRNGSALGETFGTTGMAEDEKYSGTNTGGRYVKGDGKIPVIPLDSLDLPSLGFLKLDVEGYEVFALRGATETLLRCRPIVLIEVKPRMAPRFGIGPSDAPDFLTGLGMIEVGRVGSDYIYGWPVEAEQRLAA